MATAQRQSTELARDLVGFIEAVDTLTTPDKVLDTLHEATWETHGLGVLGAFMLPIKYGDLDSLEVGKTVFLHGSVSKSWWDEALELSE